MTDTDIYKILLGFALGIIGSFFGAFFKDYFATKRNDKEALRKVIFEYKVAFAIEPVNFLGGSDKKGIFNRTFNAYHVAAAKAWLLVPESHKGKLQQAWDEYRGKGYEPHKDLEWFDTEQIFNAESESPDDSKEVVEYKERLKGLHNCLDNLL